LPYEAGRVDVAVIGAGHAGCEAALAASRLGCSVELFTISLDAVGNLPCNPSIGGTAKSHLVRELDALGGEMGRVADAATIQSRMLNRSKGPAVQSLRAQVDRRAYSGLMKATIESQPYLSLRQAEIVTLERREDGFALTTHLGALWNARCVIIATGTYLSGRVFVGDVSFESGPDGLFAATLLSRSLVALRVPLRRFKTGTPARIHADTVDLSAMEVQRGDEPPLPFSWDNERAPENRAVCYLTYTTRQTKEIILANLHRSPLYSGMIEGVGPRYCPSIEDKVVRFSDRERHPVFLEPCGMNTKEMYVQGVSSSLPEDVQIALYRTISGLERVEFMRSAYAIEYDCADPTCLDASLMCKDIPGLFGAGQFNGSSGYEEAAAQGLVAGINAARRVQGKAPVILSRCDSYIGVLIDDLVTKGCADPYRIMTSRSEYRLALRLDNAERRLTPLGHEIGLIDDARYVRALARISLLERELARTERAVIAPSDGLNAYLVSRETSPVHTGVRLADLIRRPTVRYAELEAFDPGRPELPSEIGEQAEIELRYAGYIRRQTAQIAEQQRLEGKLLPEDMDYAEIAGLRLEAREKLGKFRPCSVGQAARVSGVTPADVAVLLIWLARKESA